MDRHPAHRQSPLGGIFLLDANVRGRLSGTAPLNTQISARLWNVTAGAAVPGSERHVIQMMGDAGTGHSYGNATAPISEAINVTGPTTIQLQAIRTDEVGAPDIAQIYSNSSQGFTSLRYAQL